MRKSYGLYSSISIFLFICFYAQIGMGQCLYINNPGFESGFTSWTKNGVNASSTIINSGAHSGTQALRLNTGYQGGVYQNITGITPGTTYSLSAWVKVTGATNYNTFGIEFYTSSGAYLTYNGTDIHPDSTSWSYSYFVVTAPSNAATARIFAWKEGVSDIVYVDDYCLSIAPPNCNTTITSVNATDPYTIDGRITVSNFNATYGNITMGKEGAYKMSFLNDAVPLNSTRTYAGLAVGNYVVHLEKYSSTWDLVCTSDYTVTIGSGSLASSASTEIGGTVYGDYNANGGREAYELGLAGITVRAYNAAGTLSGSSPATTDAKGAYKITGLTASQPYRLEFSWTDGYLRPGAIGASQASIQFTTAGTSSNNFGINYPADYCNTDDPYITVPCYVNGNPTAPAIAPLDAMVAHKFSGYSTGEVSTAVPAALHLATAGQIGSVWAIAYQRNTKYLYTGATMRRFFGFGPLGTGGIYKVNMANPATPTVSNYINLSTLGINTGADTRNGTAANTLVTNPSDPTWDAEAFNKVGKVGIGGMDFSEYGDTLWLINLFDRKMYGIKNVQPTTTPVSSDVVGGYNITLPSGYACATGAADLRPWGIKYYKGKVYVGCVCSAESTPWDYTKLSAFVISFDPKNPSAGFSYVLTFPLGYNRYFYGSDPGVFDPWVSNSVHQGYIVQPIFSDLEFDVNGDLIMAFADRGGLQTGKQNYPSDPTATNTTFIEGNSYGEIVRACKTTSGYVKEGLGGCTFPNTSPASNPSAGLEYYWGETAPYSGDFTAFGEAVMGGLAQIPSGGQVIMGAQDASSWHSGGTISLNNRVGSDVKRYVIYDYYSVGGAGKSTGIGDLESLCDLAPIEIGERVFSDIDNDGIQDANEPGISAITVRLYRTSDNALIGTTTTNSLGIYKFTNLTPNTGYTIKLDRTQPTLTNFLTTLSNVGANDLIDNDGTLSGNDLVIGLTTGFPGYNNHSYDFGFLPIEICNNSIDDNGNGLIDCADPFCGFTATASNNGPLCPGSSVQLNSTPSSMTSYSWTGPGGYFSSLQNPVITSLSATFAGIYSVLITKSNGCTQTATTTVNMSTAPAKPGGIN